jgi:hypothetical protein
MSCLGSKLGACSSWMVIESWMFAVNVDRRICSPRLSTVLEPYAEYKYYVTDFQYHPFYGSELRIQYWSTCCMYNDRT